MSHAENPNDSALTQDLHDALSELVIPERPPLVAITGRGRAQQRRRLAGFAGLGVTGVAAGTALALGLTGAFGSISAGGAPTRQSAAPAGRPGTIRTAAFTLTRNADGTDTLTLSMTQMHNPATLQQALNQDGIPALVETGTYCVSSPAAPNTTSIGVRRFSHLAGRLKVRSQRPVPQRPLRRTSWPPEP